MMAIECTNGGESIPSTAAFAEAEPRVSTCQLLLERLSERLNNVEFPNVFWRVLG